MRWSVSKMPEVVDQLQPRGWDLSKDDTWTETVFISTQLRWYNRNVALFLTTSYVDFNLAADLIQTPTFATLRQTLGLDVHAAILLNSVVFPQPEDLDVFYCGFDFKTGYGAIDFSHYDSEENLEEEYLEDWGWLSDSSEVSPEWSNMQIVRAFSR
ncbi:hypothetical protein [Chroococcidiopsis sp.]|uniref:hypothetical protein n=1 Tax=Chroococcidiopsis sp. TaxID=3088168 RepID=UPI003F4013E8